MSNELTTPARAQSSWPKAHGPKLMAQSSWLKAHGSKLMAQSSWPKAHGSKLMAIRPPTINRCAPPTTFEEGRHKCQTMHANPLWPRSSDERPDAPHESRDAKAGRICRFPSPFSAIMSRSAKGPVGRNKPPEEVFLSCSYSRSTPFLLGSYSDPTRLLLQPYSGPGSENLKKAGEFARFLICEKCMRRRRQKWQG